MWVRGCVRRFVQKDGRIPELPVRHRVCWPFLFFYNFYVVWRMAMTNPSQEKDDYSCHCCRPRLKNLKQHEQWTSMKRWLSCHFKIQVSRKAKWQLWAEKVAYFGWKGTFSGYSPSLRIPSRFLIESMDSEMVSFWLKSRLFGQKTEKVIF
jgi:hypothetical protein